MSNGSGSPIILKMIGEVDVANVQSLKDCLAAWVIHGTRKAIIDLTATEFIGSTVIGVLVTAQVTGPIPTLRRATGTARRALAIATLAHPVADDDAAKEAPPVARPHP